MECPLESPRAIANQLNTGFNQSRLFDDSTVEANRDPYEKAKREYREHASEIAPEIIQHYEITSKELKTISAALFYGDEEVHKNRKDYLTPAALAFLHRIPRWEGGYAIRETVLNHTLNMMGDLERLKDNSNFFPELSELLSDDNLFFQTLQKVLFHDLPETVYGDYANGAQGAATMKNIDKAAWSQQEQKIGEEIIGWHFGEAAVDAYRDYENRGENPSVSNALVRWLDILDGNIMAEQCLEEPGAEDLNYTMQRLVDSTLPLLKALQEEKKEKAANEIVTIVQQQIMRYQTSFSKILADTNVYLEQLGNYPGVEETISMDDASYSNLFIEPRKRMGVWRPDEYVES